MCLDDLEASRLHFGNFFHTIASTGVSDGFSDHRNSSSMVFFSITCAHNFTFFSGK